MTAVSEPILALPTTLSGAAAAIHENDPDSLVDALPYLDTEYNDADRQRALQLIESECLTYRPSKNYLHHMPASDSDVFLTPCLLKEYARMAKKQVSFHSFTDHLELMSSEFSLKYFHLLKW